MPRSRQLAAIMFTDIQGYTALMQQNEDKAIQARDKHRRIFNSITEKYHGKVLQYYGDGTLSIFDSAINAVQCGIEMQLGFRTDPVIPVRIGVHTGDIIFSEEEIIGDSVNVASRIESLAVPGSLLISDKVYDEIKNQVNIQTVRLKSVKLKNVENPVVVYAISNEGLIVPDPEDLAGKTEPAGPAAGSKEPEPQQAGSGKAGAPFLAAKLFIPPSRPKAVARPRLLERLNRGLLGKLVLLSAPPGFGKTTLVSEWIPDSERPVAWLSLDAADSAPLRFMAYLVAALQKVDERLGEGVLSMLHAQPPAPVDTMLTLLLNDIATVSTPFVLVLDDYHVINSPAVDNALAFLLDYLPPPMRLIITTREDPNLPLARLRVRGQLTELRAHDLRFTSDEAAGFLNQTMGLNLSAEDVSALESRTEGWIAGLQMAALSMQGRTDKAGFIQAFAGSHRFILDYLAEEVLQRQPEQVRSFLLQTAILDRLCDALCDAVTGREDGREMLEELERGNLFVVPLDDRREWYRYHHLFADVLRARSQEERAGQAAALHRRASLWYERNGSPADAIRHALAARDLERAADLIERIWPSMDANFQSDAWLEWTRQIPEAEIRNRPVLLLAYAWAYLNKGDMEAGLVRLQEAEQWIDRLDAAGEETTTRPDKPVVGDEEQFRFLAVSAAIARTYHAQALGDVSGSVKYAQRALDRAREDDYILRGQAAALLGIIYWSNGELESAYRALSDTMDYFQQARNLAFAISVTYGLADIRLAQGRLRAAAAIYERSLRMVRETGEAPPRGSAELYLGLGDLARERGELEAAEDYLRKSEELGPQLAVPNWPCRQRVARARLLEAREDLHGALDLYAAAEQRYFRSPMPNTRPIAAQKVRLWIKQGRLPEALDWAREHCPPIDDDPNYLAEFDHLTLARTRIAQYVDTRATGRIDEAITLLENLLHAAEKGQRMGSAIEILIQLALAYAAKKDTPSALRSLERALALAEPEGYCRVFADEGQPMARLLTKAAAHRMRPAYVGKLLAALAPDTAPTPEQPPSPPPASSLRPLLEPMSDRELEILQLIAKGLSNRQISERLFLALSTVKGHNQKIFDKLEVKRRTEAVARARALGLLGE